MTLYRYYSRQHDQRGSRTVESSWYITYKFLGFWDILSGRVGTSSETRTKEILNKFDGSGAESRTRICSSQFSSKVKFIGKCASRTNHEKTLTFLLARRHPDDPLRGLRSKPVTILRYQLYVMCVIIIGPNNMSLLYLCYYRRCLWEQISKCDCNSGTVRNW